MKFIFKSVKKSTPIVMETKEEQFTPIKMEITDLPRKVSPTFYTLNDAKEALTDNVNEVIISTPKKEDPRKKVFLIKNKNKLSSFLQRNPDRSIFEVFHQYPFKMCYDFDHKKTETSLDFEKYTELVTDFIGDIFNDRDLSISGSTSEKKHSLHLVSPNYIIKNDNDLNHVKNIIRYCHENIKHEDAVQLLNDFDDSIYKKNGSMKMIYQTKHGEDRFQEPMNNTHPDFISNHFITCDIPADAKSISTHTLNGLEDIKNKQIATDQKAEVYEKPTATEVMEYLDLIDTKYLDNYGDWSKIVLSAKSTNVDFVYMCYISAKSLSYDGNTYADFDDFLDRYNPHSINRKLEELWNQSNNPMTLGSIKHYAKLSDEAKYKNICFKYRQTKMNDTFDFTQKSIAIEYTNVIGEDFLYCNKIIYKYNIKSGLWIQNPSGNLLRNSIGDEMTALYSDKIKQISTDATIPQEKKQDLIKNYSKIILSLNTRKFCLDVYKLVLDLIEDNTIAFEKNKFIFCFNNKGFDIRTGETCRALREDYMYITTGYDWREPSKNELDTIHELINTIFPIEEEKKLYLSILSTGLLGETLQKFILANGCGGNGKGTLNDLFMTAIGNYGYHAHNEILLKPIKKGANPEVANMENKRFIIYREPDTEGDSKINFSSVKELTGGSNINARMCNSNKVECPLRGTHILECNDKPAIGGKMDNSVARRLIDMPFRSTFVSNTSEHEGDYIYKGNNEVSTDEFRDKYKYALFKIVMSYYKNGLDIETIIPDSIKRRTAEYMESNDELLQWIKEDYDYTGNDADIIRLTDLYNDYKRSDAYRNLSRDEKRKKSKNKFKDCLFSIKTIKKCYTDRYKKYGKDITSVFVGYRPKSDFIEEDELN